MPTESPRVQLTRDLSPVAVRAALKAGDVERLRRGAVVGQLHVGDGVRRQEHPDARARRLALARIRAVDRQLTAPHVFSHESAALLWGLTLWRPPDRTHVIQQYRAGSSSARDIARHRAPLDRWTMSDGVPTTDLTRTVVDCLVTLPALDGLVLADSAVRAGLATSSALALVAARTQARGRVRAGLLLTLADGGAESPWESWLRYLALRAGLPRPVTQHLVSTRVGPARVDVAWPAHGVLAEFDGMVKYEDGVLAPGYSGARALMDEKRRGDAITEATGRRLLRFTSRDAADPEATTSRLLSAFPPEVSRTARPDRRLPLPLPRGSRSAGANK